MMIPNAERAVITTEKLTAYLLNPSYKRGAAKARLLLSLGYRTVAPEVLELDLRTQHLALDVTRTSANDYGVVYEIEGPDHDPRRPDSALLLNLADRYWQRGPTIDYDVSEVAECPSSCLPT